MYLKAEPHPKYNETVRDIQSKLNAIRVRVNGNWPSLEEDGKFGPKTEEAVKAFQRYRKITVSGEVGDTTLYYIYETYRKNMTYISAKHSYISANPPYKYSYITERKSYISAKPSESFWDIAINIVDALAGIVKGGSERVAEEIKRCKGIKEGKIPVSELRRLGKFLIDDELIKASIEKLEGGLEKKLYKEIEKEAKTTLENKRHVSYEDRAMHRLAKQELELKKKNMQSASFKKNYSKAVDTVLNEFIKRLESLDVARLIDNKIKSLIPKGCKVKVSGGGILTALTLMPLAAHFIELVYNSLRDKSMNMECVRKVINDIIQVIIGGVISFIVGTLLASAGVPALLTIIVVAVSGLVFGCVCNVFWPNWDERATDWVMGFPNRVFEVLNSPVYQQSVRTSFV